MYFHTDDMTAANINLVSSIVVKKDDKNGSHISALGSIYFGAVLSMCQSLSQRNSFDAAYHCTYSTLPTKIYIGRKISPIVQDFFQL